MCRVDAGGAAIVKGGVECHAGTHAGTFHLSLLVYLCSDSVPAERGDRPVDHGTDPSLVNGVGDTVDINCGGGGLQVGVVPVEQLMPEAIARLQCGQAADMRFQEFKDPVSSGVVCWQYVQRLHQREQRPAVGSPPEESRLSVGCLYPSVAEESFFFDEHLFPKEGDLPHRLVEIATLTGRCTHLCDGRDAHEHVIEPDGVHLWPLPGKGAIVQPVFVVHDVVHIVCNHRFQLQPGFHARCLDHGSAHGACIVECRRPEDLPHLGIGGAIISQHLLECRPDLRNEAKAICRVCFVSLVAGYLRRCQHGCVGDPPLVARETEISFFQSAMLINLIGCSDLLPGLVVDQNSGRHLLEIGQDAIQILFDGFRFRNAVRSVVVGFHQVQRGVEVVFLIFFVLCMQRWQCNDQ